MKLVDANAQKSNKTNGFESHKHTMANSIIINAMPL